jgi:hypothetical protein
MAKVAERQVVLLDACQGLLTRLYAMTNFETPNHFDESLERVCRHLVTKFPAYPDGLEKVLTLTLSSPLLFFSRGPWVYLFRLCAHIYLNVALLPH